MSVHGANRLGTNSLLDINVFGRRAGIAAANYATGHDHVAMPADPAAMVVGWVGDILSEHGNERVADIRGALQQSMDNNAAVFRTEETLKQALTDIHALKERYARITVHDKGSRYNSDLLEAIELGFLLELAEVTVVGALNRKESRGGHAREDYPQPRRHQLHAPHDGVQGRYRPAQRHPAGLQAGRADPVRTDGTEVLMTTAVETRSRSAATSGARRLPTMVTLKIARFNPEDPDAAGWQSFPRAVPAVATACSTCCCTSRATSTAR